MLSFVLEKFIGYTKTKFFLHYDYLRIILRFRLLYCSKKLLIHLTRKKLSPLHHSSFFRVLPPPCRTCSCGGWLFLLPYVPSKCWWWWRCAWTHRIPSRTYRLRYSGHSPLLDHWGTIDLSPSSLIIVRPSTCPLVTSPWITKFHDMHSFASD